jgi:DNA-binding transcriptional LysR family regulator
MDRLAAMEVFVRVVETGSFSAAARQLRVGQPAVSKTVAQLEGRLGVQLLLRSSRGLTPTEAGQNFYERAKRAIEEANEADLAATGAGAGLSGRLRFGGAVTFCQLHLIPHLSAFLERHPDLTVEAVLDDRNVDLIEEGVDVALRIGQLADSAMTARRIGRTGRRVIGTPGYFARFGVPTHPDELSHRAAVIHTLGGGAVWTFTREGVARTVTLDGPLRITAGEGIRAAVLAGLGLTVATDWMFHPELADGRVQAVMADWRLPDLDLWAVFPTGPRASAKARAFATFVEERMRAAGFAP